MSQSLREAALRAMYVCREAGRTVTFDINMRAKLWPMHIARASLEYAFRRADVVFSSREDAQSLYGTSEPAEAAERIRAIGPETVVVKLGGEGCYVSSGGESFMCPGYRVKPVDTTGAEDAFDGAWVSATLEGWDLRERARFANAVGALTATGLGAVAPIPGRAQALKLMEEQGDGR